MPEDKGRGNRTVILPNPGGRRAGGAAPEANPWSPPAEDYGRPGPSAPPSYAPPPAYPQSPLAAAPAYVPRAAAPVYVAPSPDTSPDSAAALLVAEPALNANEMLRAAAPLLLMLGKLRANLVRVPSDAIMNDVAHAIAGFGHAVTTAGYSADQAEVARYALCAAADDVVQNIAVDDRALWTRYSMLSKFFGERTGGVRFFEELGRMRQDPLGNIDVIELMYACIAVGFEGVYRTAPNGVASLQQIQRELYDVIRRVRPREGFELSPHWQGSGLALSDRRRRVPVWVIAALGLTIVVGTLFVLRFLLAGASGAVAGEMVALYPPTPVALIRPDFVPTPPPAPAPSAAPEPQAVVPPQPAPEPTPAPPPPQEVSLADQLANLACVDVKNLNGAVRVTFGDCKGTALFASGRAELTDAYLPVVNRVAQAVEGLPGKVVVIGHTDNVPIRGIRFASNYDLSVARAETVAKVIAAQLSVPSRIVAEGKGDTAPVADNKTPEGRAWNRRVEVVVQTEE